MKNMILKFISLIILILTLATVLIGCDNLPFLDAIKPSNNCNHQYGEHELIVGGECQNRKYTATCIKCGFEATISGTAESHRWQCFEEVFPTCGSTGYKRYKCVECEKIKKETLSTTRTHSWESVIVESTCTTQGYAYNKCSVCYEEQDKVWFKLKEHNWVTSIVNSTCKVKGTKTLTCLDCQQTQTESLPLANHEAKEEIYKDETHHWRICSECRCSMNIAQHKMKIAISDTPNYHTLYCSVCNYSTEEACTNDSNGICVLCQKSNIQSEPETTIILIP